MTDGPMLLVSLTDPADPAPGGRELLYRMNHAVLADLLGERLLLYTPPRQRERSIGHLLRGHVDGIDCGSIEAIYGLIEAHRIGSVFLDGSNLGAAAQAIRRRYPAMRIFTFFHNVETRFFAGALRAKPSVRALAVLLANHLAERAAVQASDRLLCLSPRDSLVLRRLHGRAADAILPLAIHDRRPLAPDYVRAGRHRFLLFVGGGFYANRQGMAWFARSVAPRIRAETVIVGRGMEGITGERVRAVGGVEDLASWYRAAHAVVAPIHDGSGMKTKVAEALMFGKRVIGTPEAFSGYGEAVVGGNWLCRTADDFVRAIETEMRIDAPAFDPTLRALYERFHSFPAARTRMAEAIGLPTSSS
jgi:glycosyltransferase involved in cell wall biosynthesis